MAYEHGHSSGHFLSLSIQPDFLVDFPRNPVRHSQPFVFSSTVHQQLKDPSQPVAHLQWTRGQQKFELNSPTFWWLIFGLAWLFSLVALEVVISRQWIFQCDFPKFSVVLWNGNQRHVIWPALDVDGIATPYNTLGHLVTVMTANKINVNVKKRVNNNLVYLQQSCF